MIIKTQDELNHFCQNLRSQPFVTVDTEFLREKTYYPKLCLVQVSGPDKNARAIDPIAYDLNLTALYDLLLDKKVLKIFHAGRQDVEIFYNLMGKVVSPIFDTQIAAMVCGYGDSVGYDNLVRNVLDEKIDKSNQYTNWAQRPLTEKQLDYALADVTHLVDIYQHLTNVLDEQGRTQWVFEEEGILTDPATYENPPEQAWQRIKVRSPKSKTLAVLRDLAAWRERRAQKKDIPRNWVMRDDALADMAAQCPNDEKQLSRIRNMSADVAKGRVGQELLKIIKLAQKSDKNKWPKVERPKPLTPDQSAMLDILKLVLKVQAAQNGVANKLIASNDELKVLASHKQPDVKTMKGWRYELFGRYVDGFKAGKLAIGVVDGQITIIDQKS